MTEYSGWIRRGLLGIAFGLAVMLCLMLSACGGSSPSAGVAQIGSTSTTGGVGTTESGTASTQSAEQALLAFAQCMRRHGISDFPDPRQTADGTYGWTNLNQLRQLVRGDAQAFTTCEPLLAGTGITSPANIAKFQQDMLAFAKCMRTHGVSDFPDPNSNGRFGGQVKNLDTSTPIYQAAKTACRPELSAARNLFSISAGSP